MGDMDRDDGGFYSGRPIRVITDHEPEPEVASERRDWWPDAIKWVKAYNAAIERAGGRPLSIAELRRVTDGLPHSF